MKPGKKNLAKLKADCSGYPEGDTVGSWGSWQCHALFVDSAWRDVIVFLLARGGAVR